MARSVWPKLLGIAALAPLASCGWIERAQRPAWRTQTENACIASGHLKASSFVEPLREIDGPGICGLTHPFKVSALFDGAIPFDKPLVMDCSMTPALEAWLGQSVQPIAMARLGSPIASVQVFGAYSCRSVDNIAGAQLSEHAFGNAVDIAGFKLADGREISIVRDWKKSDTQESAFLREAHAAACQHFTTVLGPGADVFHYNHFHLDLANHGTTNTGPRKYCKPSPAPNLLPPPGRPDGLPPAPDVEEPMDVARAGPSPRQTSYLATPLPLHGLNVALPPRVQTLEEPPAAPILPAESEAGVDGAPTSSIPLSHDD